VIGIYQAAAPHIDFAGAGHLHAGIEQGRCHLDQFQTRTMR
jgi:hypothetical protein